MALKRRTIERCLQQRDEERRQRAPHPTVPHDDRGRAWFVDVLGVMALALLVGCGQPTPPQSAAAVTAQPSVTVTAQPAAAAKPADPRRTVISYSYQTKISGQDFTIEGIVMADGSGGMSEPAGRMMTPPNAERAAQANAFANRLASFTITPATPGGCSLTFTGLGQAQPTEDDKRDVRRFAGC
jgi:hypothetical protein